MVSNTFLNFKHKSPLGNKQTYTLDESNNLKKLQAHTFTTKYEKQISVCMRNLTYNIKSLHGYIVFRHAAEFPWKPH